MFYIIWQIFSQFKYFVGEKTQTRGPSPDPVLILYLDPGLNPDPSANPDLVKNSDPVEYRSGCRIRVSINSVTNPDQISYSMAVINPDPVKNLVTNPLRLQIQFQNRIREQTLSRIRG
jgi:hypothetical protein